MIQCAGWAGVFISSPLAGSAHRSDCAALCDLYRRVAVVQVHWTKDHFVSPKHVQRESECLFCLLLVSLHETSAGFSFILLHVAECRREADSAGVSGGFKGRPLYCSSAVALRWTCVGMEGEWGWGWWYACALLILGLFCRPKSCFSSMLRRCNWYFSRAKNKKKIFWLKLKCGSYFALSVCFYELFKCPTCLLAVW